MAYLIEKKDEKYCRKFLYNFAPGVSSNTSKRNGIKGAKKQTVCAPLKSCDINSFVYNYFIYDYKEITTQVHHIFETD